jgi:glycosyltransferase involved in cell wall biosynthesis
MKVLFITRATLFTVYGGDTMQIVSTAKYLRKLGVEVDIKLANEKIDYSSYDLLHLFNIIRPADLLPHITKSKKPYVVSTIYVDYSDYQEYHSTGLVSMLRKVFSNDQLEYIKAMGRWLKNGEAVNSMSYLFRGHKRSVQRIAEGALCLLPNSESEYRRFVKDYAVMRPYRVIWNGVDPEIFPDNNEVINKDARLVVCVSRIEGKKNHLNLIKALNGTEFRLMIVGKPAPNHQKYYDECRRIAASNISFEDFIPQEKLIGLYCSGRVHVLPSWNETCGLSSLEAGYYRCNLVITDKGDTVDYFGNDAWYCDPADPASIYEAVKKASMAPISGVIHDKVKNLFNWEHAARQTLDAYLNFL